MFFIKIIYTFANCMHCNCIWSGVTLNTINNLEFAEFRVIGKERAKPECKLSVYHNQKLSLGDIKVISNFNRSDLWCLLSFSKFQTVHFLTLYKSLAQFQSQDKRNISHFAWLVYRAIVIAHKDVISFYDTIMKYNVPFCEIYAYIL